jgi:dihydroorotase
VAGDRSGQFDLLVVGGEVLDPEAGRQGRYDIGITNGRIAAMGPRLRRDIASEVVDASGCIVLPGLVDLHTHVFEGSTFWGVDPRPIAWRTGVTTWVDAGSAGAYNAPGLQRFCTDCRPLRSKAFLNISCVGLVAETGEARQDDLCDAALCAGVLEQYREFFVGVKCRMDRNAVGDMGLEPLRRALCAANAARLPVMVHIAAGPPAIDDVLDLLRPGDILTHCATGQNMSLIGRDGRPRASALRARERGVLFDVGHGSGSFSFSVAESLLRAGFPPDIISSDVHQRSVLGPAFDLPTCISKFLALGMSVEAVVRAATAAPALAIRDMEAGSLEVGKRADLGIFELEEGNFDFFDTDLDARHSARLLVNRATYVAGVLLGPVAPRAPAPWVQVTAGQRALFSGGLGDLRRPWATRLRSPECFVRPGI